MDSGRPLTMISSDSIFAIARFTFSLPFTTSWAPSLTVFLKRTFPSLAACTMTLRFTLRVTMIGSFFGIVIAGGCWAGSFTAVLRGSFRGWALGIFAGRAFLTAATLAFGCRILALRFFKYEAEANMMVRAITKSIA